MLVVVILPAERHREKAPPQLTFLVSNTKLIKFILTPSESSLLFYSFRSETTGTTADEWPSDPLGSRQGFHDHLNLKRLEDRLPFLQVGVDRGFKLGSLFFSQYEGKTYTSVQLLRPGRGRLTTHSSVGH